MECKYCGAKINLSIFGMPDDVCWGCMEDDGKEDVLQKNVKVKPKNKIKKMRNERK